MVINDIHNKLLTPEGSAQLFHQWERIDSISNKKVYFYSGSYSDKYNNKNAETQKTDSKEFDNLLLSTKNNGLFNNTFVNKNFFAAAA
jgi:hypothetical protein